MICFSQRDIIVHNNLKFPINHSLRIGFGLNVYKVERVLHAHSYNFGIAHRFPFYSTIYELMKLRVRIQYNFKIFIGLDSIWNDEGVRMPIFLSPFFGLD